MPERDKFEHLLSQEEGEEKSRVKWKCCGKRTVERRYFPELGREC